MRTFSRALSSILFWSFSRLISIEAVTEMVRFEELIYVNAFWIDAHSLNDCLIKGNNDYTHKPFNPLTPKWPASSFSLQYHPWIKHQGHEY